ncbi:hypothetical protein G6F57_009165 [Rhizopus arrhizus]|nr:hypothetical protein G6F21_009063 [Rhizopus arrhizus]KAG1411221.1 hypothetical protein G6F58_008681 [Rhizopus delemar]KAG0808381.1 hypothetical protein G6F20_009628 [Rhizopus arrhizus]KAG0825673.1 hypothetical protein G6F19_009701 [Rhizopus arrhizus]KAG0827072.1 hypothetical protein G6F18_009657 [Rhizopus arrhizus]
MYRRRKIIKEEKPEIPKTLDEFGYVLKENGEIRSKSEDLIGDEVEKRLEAEPYNFQVKTIPTDADPSKDPHSFIYMTPNALTTTDKLIVFIPGNHTRIGQWSRRVLCDENIYTGSMMDTTRRFQEKGYEVIILNPNGNYWYNNRAWDCPEPHSIHVTMVPGSEDPEKHCQYVFNHFIKNLKAEKIAVLALGWGGHAFTQAFDENFDALQGRIKCAAMSNSVHSSDMLKNEGTRRWLFDNCINWVVSAKAKGEIITDPRFGCTCISSNLEISDFTLTECIDDIMDFIFVKMGDIERKEIEEDEDEITLQEVEELSEHLEITSVE